MNAVRSSVLLFLTCAVLVVVAVTLLLYDRQQRVVLLGVLMAAFAILVT